MLGKSSQLGVRRIPNDRQQKITNRCLPLDYMRIRHQSLSYRPELSGFYREFPVFAVRSKARAIWHGTGVLDIPSASARRPLVANLLARLIAVVSCSLRE